MKIKMFEVEKKFKIPANFTRVLLEQGWKYSKEIHLKDTYFDTESYGLTRNNYWFRKRDTKWQLKCPIQDERQADSVRIDRYQEIEEEKAIFDRLALVLKVESGTMVGETTSNVEIFGLKPIA
jgi:adenylate cyclase class IV